MAPLSKLHIQAVNYHKLLTDNEVTSHSDSKGKARADLLCAYKEIQPRQTSVIYTGQLCPPGKVD